MRRQRPEARAPVRGRVLDQALQQLGPRARPGLEPRQAPGPEAAQRRPLPGPVQALQLAQAVAPPVGAAQVVARVSAVVQAAVAA